MKAKFEIVITEKQQDWLLTYGPYIFFGFWPVVGMVGSFIWNFYH